MIDKEQEPKLNNVPEQGEKTESIADHLREKKEEQIKDIEGFDFTDVGYSEEDIAQNESLRKTVDKYIEESGDDHGQFLKLLTQQGIRVIENSSFLSSQQSTQQFLGRLTGRGESGVNALFATQDMVNNYLSDDTPENIRKELEAVHESTGVIFLGKQPNQKSVFHEGSHAIQHLSGMNMDAKDEETKLRREIEVNTALIRAKNSGKLKGVSRGEYRIGKGPFGETATLGTNDIYQEVDYFTQNRKRLSEIVLEKRKAEDEKASAQKIEDIRKKLKEM
ncbi:MAG: hypothetical protein Q8M83_00070 [bacterium]|nr:hypothetical protein [bacterium]